MASSFAPWWKRLLFRTPLYKRGPCQNYHFRTDKFCFCRVNEHCGDWNGGIYSFETGQELFLDTSRPPYNVPLNRRAHGGTMSKADESSPVQGDVKRPEQHLHDGEPCSPGCAAHISHPCEHCGRVGARGEYVSPMKIPRPFNAGIMRNF
jgi:hypothetical protein